LEEAFLEFSNRVTSDLASRWTEIATSVLLDPNPLEGLTPIERIAAQLEGRRRTYSSTLRRGIADSLALAGAIEPTSDGTNHAALVAERVVRDVLRQVVSDAEGRTWLAIVDVLPLLAEAAPDAFLSALEDDLSASEPTVGCLFQTTEDPLWLGPSSQQHHLLWALEALCWSPEHLVRAIQILARLCRFDLPRNSGNTPLSSMATVLCGWVRNTDADLSTRLQAIDACRVVDASTGWSLIKRLWPDSRGWVSPPYEPRYQLWKSNSESVPNREWFSFISGMTDRIVEWAESDPDEMPWLIEALAKVGSDEADRIIGFLEAVAARADLDDDVRLRLFEKAREIAVKHERFQTSDWAMPLERRTRLSALAEQFQPANDLRRFAYLFNWHPDLPGVEMRDHEHYSAELDTRRREALDLLFNQQDGWEQLATIVKRAEAPTQIGWTLATYEQEGALDVMFDWLSSDNAALQKAAEAWVHRHLAVQGPADLRDALGRNDVSSDGLKLFVLNVPTASQYWDALHEFPEAADIFWSTAHFEYVPDEDLAEAIEVLVERGRPWSAIAVASNGLLQRTQDADGHLPSTELIISVLRAALAQDPDPAARDQMTGYNVGTLLDYLAEADVSISDLASLEFAYFRLLEHSREPQALNLALASDPGLFVDLVRHTYRGANEAKRGDDGSDPLAEHGWWVLHAWKGFPGRREDGTLDEVGMQRWVREARLQLSELDRTDIGDEVIGQTFAYAPSDPDGIWPPQSVRDLIESIGSRDLENGVVTGRLNSRGVTTRSVYEGGSQERTLAEQHKQSSLRVQAQWPRSARILRTIADSYDRDAIQQDQKAQIDQDLD